MDEPDYSNFSDEQKIEALEIDLDVAQCGDILEAHGVAPTPELVSALWDWKESARQTPESV